MSELARSRRDHYLPARMIGTAYDVALSRMSRVVAPIVNKSRWKIARQFSTDNAEGGNFVVFIATVGSTTLSRASHGHSTIFPRSKGRESTEITLNCSGRRFHPRVASARTSRKKRPSNCHGRIIRLAVSVPCDWHTLRSERFPYLLLSVVFPRETNSSNA